jgi:hypothetical protein
MVAVADKEVPQVVGLRNLVVRLRVSRGHLRSSGSA